MRNAQYRTWNMASNTEKRGKWEMLTVVHGLLREKWKKCGKWDKKYCMTWNMVRKTEKREKMRNAHCRNMARNTENRVKSETSSVWPGTWRETLKNDENVKCTLYDLEYGQKTEKCGKWETHTIGVEYGLKQWKTWKMWNANFMTYNMARNTENHGKWEMLTVWLG